MKFDCVLHRRGSPLCCRRVGVVGLLFLAMTYPFDLFFGLYRLEGVYRIKKERGIK